MNRFTIGIIAVLTLLLIVFYGRIASLRDRASNYEALYKQSQKKAKVWQDKAGNWRSRAETADISVRTLKDLVKNGDKRFVDLSKSFEGLNKNLKNLQNLTNTNTNSIVNFTTNLRDTTIVVVQGNTSDSIPVVVQVFEWKDSLGYSTFSGQINNGEITGAMSITDSLDMVTYWKRPWLLGKKKYFTEIRSKNPATRIIYNKSIVVKPKRRRLLGIL